jgi:hypothetical protein
VQSSKGCRALKAKACVEGQLLCLAPSGQQRLPITIPGANANEKRNTNISSVSFLKIIYCFWYSQERATHTRTQHRWQEGNVAGGCSSMQLAATKLEWSGSC